MTRIIVAHRPETIRSADRVITVSKGRVAQDEKVRVEAEVEPLLDTE